MIKISAQSLMTLERGLAEAPAATERELLAAMTEATMLLESELVDHYFPVSSERPAHPKAKQPPSGAVHTNTTITSDVWSTPAGVLGLVGSNQIVALFVELGTRPHEIRAKDAKALAFPLGVSGEFGVYKAVKHPGTKPQGVFAKARDANLPQIVRMFEDAAGRIARQLGLEGGAA